MLGIEFATRSVQTMGGKTRYEPKVFWLLDGYSHGAAFEGSYSYAKGSLAAIKKEFPKDVELHRIASDLTALQRQHGYRLACSVSARDSFPQSMDIDTDFHNVYNELLELMRDFARYIYRRIVADYDYRMSDENVDDSIRANEYEFTEEGERA